MLRKLNILFIPFYFYAFLGATNELGMSLPHESSEQHSLESWRNSFSPTEDAKKKAASFEQRASLVQGKSCETPHLAYLKLNQLRDEFLDYEVKAKESLFGPVPKEYEAGQGPCKNTWYRGNPALARVHVERGLFYSTEIQNKNLCM